MSGRQNLYWSVRRELWENRSIHIAPLAVAGLVLVGFLIGSARLLEKMRALPALDPVKQLHAVVVPYSMAASVIILTGWLVGIFYSLDALNGERRDRSILFWKSMPVSDFTTVLAKALIPLAALPVITYVVALATQLLMLLASTVVIGATGGSPALLWNLLPLPRMSIVMAYGTVVHALWFAPIFGWLLLVSAWVRRAPFLWAVLPPIAIMAVERLALGTLWFASLLKYRFMGGMTEAFATDAMKGPITELSQLDPMRFLSSPGLWLGLVFAAICIAAAIRLRRYRDPN